MERQSQPSQGEPGELDEPPAPPDWAYGLARVLDDALRVPGTSFRFGLDGLLGLLLPVAGDVIGGVASMSLLVLAFQMRVPKVVLVRMVVNVAIDALTGMIPLLGDLFDFAWRANRRNVELIERYRGQPQRRPTPGDYAFVGLALLASLLAIAAPIVLTIVVLSWLRGLFAGA